MPGVKDKLLVFLALLLVGCDRGGDSVSSSAGSPTATLTAVSAGTDTGGRTSTATAVSTRPALGSATPTPAASATAVRPRQPSNQVLDSGVPSPVTATRRRGDPLPPRTVNPTQSRPTWDASTVLAYRAPTTADFPAGHQPDWLDPLSVPCASESDGRALMPAPRNVTCFDEFLKSQRASDSALAYFRATSETLQRFEERGRVDTGTSFNPWCCLADMPGGITQAVLLNVAEAPDGLRFVSDYLLGAELRGWLAHPAYLAVRTPGVDEELPFGLETAIEPGTAGSGAEQRFIVSDTLQGCRACPRPARLRVMLTFDATGRYVRWELLPPELLR